MNSSVDQGPSLHPASWPLRSCRLTSAPVIDTRARLMIEYDAPLGRLAGQGSFSNYVVVYRASLEPSTAILSTTGPPGTLSALLTYATGRTWPDAKGESLMRALLEKGRVVVLAFRDLGDALACHRRLQKQLTGVTP